MRLSIVSTLYRSGPYVREFHRRMTASARRLTNDYEIVLVNDGSPDDSLAIALQTADPHVRVVDLSRNFGHHQAMWIGLAHACGEQIFLIDCDLEESPEWLDDFERTRAGRCVEQIDVELFQHFVIEAQDRRRILDQKQARFCRHALSVATRDNSPVWFLMAERSWQHHYRTGAWQPKPELTLQN